MPEAAAFKDLAEVRRYIEHAHAELDPHSRYVSELLAALNGAADLTAFERRMLDGCRGQRHAGADVFAKMTLREKVLANLITPETTLFRFTEGELEALDREILPHVQGRKARVLVVPCSLGDEAFTVAAFLLKRKLDFEIHAFDIQPALVESARSGRLTFGFPVEHLETPGKVSAEVLARIHFEVGNAFALPLPDQAKPFDAVLCRNFIGYFVADKAQRLLERLAPRVAPGGALFLDGFCLAKFPELTGLLRQRGAARVGERPVFLFPKH
ncbi:MAG: methyltransferase domain-containing protein [Planctomycetota bacterium]|nr:methyltransferase domain-containing protein [Planctomycetota bacterium]